MPGLRDPPQAIEGGLLVVPEWSDQVPRLQAKEFSGKVPAPQTATFCGAKTRFLMRLSPTDPTVFGDIEYYGLYEPKTARLFRTLIRGLRTFSGIGANVGWYTLLAAKAGMHANSFEPSLEVFRLLKLSVAVDKFMNLTSPTPEGCGVPDSLRHGSHPIGLPAVSELAPKIEHALSPASECCIRHYSLVELVSTV